MAAYGPAVQRIKWLMSVIDGSQTDQPYRQTPATIGTRIEPSGIYSYDLRIMRPWIGGWEVLDTESTATTNRHIRAAHFALQEMGYTNAGTNYGVDHDWIRYGRTA